MDALVLEDVVLEKDEAAGAGMSEAERADHLARFALD
jgi:hypothetical protein